MTIRGLATRALIAAGIAILPAFPAQAAPTVALESAVYVERSDETSRVLHPASQLSRGDRVVTILTWRRSSPPRQFTLTNPLPRGLYYQGSASSDEQVSADDGKSWGKLGALRIGQRMATPEDVTHVRWRVMSSAPSGRIAYSAIVR